MKISTQQFTKKNTFFKIIIGLSLLTSNCYPGVLGTPADIVTLGSAAKGWLSSRGKNKDNIHRMFYQVNKKTTSYVESRLTESNKKQICGNLNKSAIEFLNGAEINETDFYHTFYNEAKKQHKKNPALSINHYLFSDLKSYRSFWFNEQLKGLLLGAKIRNEDIENLEFFDVDLSKYELKNLFSLDNSFYAGNYTPKNGMRAILIYEAINLTGFQLLEKHCNPNKKELIFLDNNYYVGKWRERNADSKFVPILTSKKNIEEKSISSTIYEHKKAVDLASNAYSSIELFEKKYKNSSNQVGSAVFNNVRFFAIDESDKIYITFRGTSSKANAKTDLNIKHTNFMNIPNAQVHSGFYNIALKSKEILRNLISKEKEIIISGHSLGGAVGLLLGSLIYNENPKKDIRVYSFGAPPVGNDVFTNNIKGLKHFRYVHIKDIVPKINKPVADKFKDVASNIAKFKPGKITKLPISFGLQNITSKITNIPYDFVHYGRLIELSNKPISSSTNNSKIDFLKQFIKFDDAHSIVTYADGIKNYYSTDKLN